MGQLLLFFLVFIGSFLVLSYKLWKDGGGLSYLSLEKKKKACVEGWAFMSFLDYMESKKQNCLRRCDAVYPEVKSPLCVFPLGRDYIMH